MESETQTFESKWLKKGFPLLVGRYLLHIQLKRGDFRHATRPF